METPLLIAEHLTKDFHIEGFIRRRYLRAVDDVSFQIRGDKPTIVSLIGESGSGKTTIGKMILGLIRPSYGKLLYEGQDVVKLVKKKSLEYRRNVQAVFQDPYASFNPFYKVGRTLIKTLKKFKVSSNLDDVIRESLEFLKLRPEQIMDAYPHQLSGGQLQRVLIARALMLKPKLIVADEPVSMIDASLRASILKLMLDLKEKQGISIIYITHDLSTAYHISDEVIALYRGRIMEMGDASSVIEKPLHPYVKMLIESIPVPDPNRRWKENLRLKEDTSETISIIRKKDDQRNYCIFKKLCPYAFERCSKEKPELAEVEKNHRVACHMY